MPLAVWPKLLYRCLTISDTSEWQPLQPIDSYSGPIVLKEIKLAPGAYCRLEFRFANSKAPFQATTIERPAFTPGLAGVFQHNKLYETAAHGRSHAGAPDSIVSIVASGNRVILQPGIATDFFFRQKGWSIDSCLEYRLRLLNSKPGNWNRTTLLLHLPALEGNSNYELELRYTGGGTPIYLYLDTNAYWYQSKRMQVFFWLASILVLTCILWWYYRYNLRKARLHRQRVEEQLERLQNKLNPHFIYNSLSSIQGLISSGHNERANDYLSVFSTMMRQTMAVAERPVISLAEDLDQVEQYLRIEQLRFEFSYGIQVDPEINLESIEMPPHFLQPTIENAVKHGVAGMGAAGFIKVHVQKINDNLSISVINNSKEVKPKHNGTGYGMRYTQEQVARLCQLYGGKKILYNTDIGATEATVRFFFENWLKP